ncbi:MAG: tetratricopeptide repeat protein [Spirochaetota bacterium]
MKNKIICTVIASFILFSVDASAQYQYRSDDNSDIIKMILEEKVPVQRKAEAPKESAPAAAPPAAAKAENEAAPPKAVTAAAKKKTAPKKGNTAAKKKGGEIPPAAGADKVLLDTGINLLDAGNDPAAIEKFRQLKEKYPAGNYSDLASIWLAKAYLKQGKYREAAAEAEGIAEDSGEYPAAVFLAGQIYRTQKNNDKALDAFYRVSSRFPGHDLADNALIETGKIYLSMKNGSQALSSASIVVRSYPDRETLPDAYYLIGMVLEKDPAMRDIEKARLVLRKFVYRAETEKADSFAKSPLLDRVKRELLYLDRNFFGTQ